MAEVVRCKFECVEVIKRKHWSKTGAFLFDYKMQAVTGDTPENKLFFDATPSGELSVRSVKSDFFEPGKQYFIDISEA